MVNASQDKVEKHSFDKHTYIILATLVFVAGLFFGNLSDPQTGYGIYGRLSYLENDPLTKDRGLNPVTIIEVTPKQISPGETLTIHVDPGIRGARQKVSIFRVNEQGYGQYKGDTNFAGFRGATTIQNTGFVAYLNSTFQYKTGTSWPRGTYEARIYDLNKRDYVSDIFEIIKEY